jgi:hypothetical protein
MLADAQARGDAGEQERAEALLDRIEVQLGESGE